MRVHVWLAVALLLCESTQRAAADFSCCVSLNAGLPGCGQTTTYNDQGDCYAVNQLVAAFNIVLQPAVGASLDLPC